MPSKYTIVATKQFFKDLKRLDSQKQKKVFQILLNMKDDPFGEALLYDLKGFHSKRVGRGYRIIYKIEGKKVIALAVGPHKIYEEIKRRKI